MNVVFFSQRVLGWRGCRVCHFANLSLSLRRIMDRSINSMGVVPASSVAQPIYLWFQHWHQIEKVLVRVFASSYDQAVRYIRLRWLVL